MIIVSGILTQFDSKQSEFHWSFERKTLSLHFPPTTHNIFIVGDCAMKFNRCESEKKYLYRSHAEIILLYYNLYSITLTVSSNRNHLLPVPLRKQPDRRRTECWME